MEILTSSLENQSEIKHQIEFISEPEVIIKAEVARLRWYMVKKLNFQILELTIL